MPIDVRKPRSSGKRVQVLNATDFTGGLNLVSDTFKLAPNESPDLLNVDVDGRGGFQLRKGVGQFIPGNAGGEIFSLSSISQIVASVGVGRLVASANGAVRYHNGTVWVNCTGSPALTYGQFIRTATMNNLWFAQVQLGYIGGSVARKLTIQNTAGNPVAITPMVDSGSGVWQDSYANPGATDAMPQAKCIAPHTGYMWVANTYENFVAFPNRVRFSHPNNPQRWRRGDYIDVDFAGDEITALVPFRDHLLVFKRNSVFALFGYDPESFQLIKIADGIGAVSQEAVVAAPQGVFFFDAELGVHVYDGEAPMTVFTPLFPLLRDHEIDPADVDQTHLGWVNGRLWCSVAEGDSHRTTTYVFDPTVGEHGAWMRYALAMGCYLRHGEGGVATEWGSRSIQLLDVPGATSDNFGDGFVHIPSYYTTVWVDMHEPAVNKRWRRMEIVTRAGVTSRLLVTMFKDYNTETPVKSFYINLAESSETLLWDDGILMWDGAAWEVSGDFNVIEQGGTLGLARAVQLRIDGPSTDQKWGVDALMFKFIPKKVR